MMPATLRVMAGTADQVLSSVSNAFIVFAVARVTDVDTFGAAVLVFTLIAAAIGLVRGAFGTPLLLMGGESGAEIRAETSRAAAAAAAFGAVVAVVVVVTSALMNVLPIGIAFAISVPMVLAQDAYRFGAVTLGKPEFALVSDGTWAAGSSALLVVTWLSPKMLSDTQIVWGWGISAAVALSLLVLQLDVIPRWRGLVSWLRNDPGLRLRFGLENGIEQLTVIAIVSTSTAIIGTVAAAALRGAGTILGPIAILLSAQSLVAIPEAARAGYSLTQLRKTLRNLAVLTSTAALLVGMSALWVPEQVGALVLGKSWSEAAAVLPYLGVEYAALCWVASAYNLFRVQKASGRLVRARILQSLSAVVLCSVIAAIFRTPTSVAAALAISACLTAAALMVRVRHEVKSSHPSHRAEVGAVAGAPRTGVAGEHRRVRRNRRNHP